MVEYEATFEDMQWVKKNPRLSLDDFEALIDLFEKCTGTNTDIALLHVCKKEAEMRFPTAKVHSIPQDTQMAVYNHWQKKREIEGKPCLRRYWPKPDSNDSSPFVSFRTRNNERMKLRRKKAGDKDKMLENYIERRRELISGRSLLLNILHRETTKTELLDADFLSYKSQSSQGGRSTKGMSWTKTLDEAEKKRKNYEDWKTAID